MSRVTTSTLKTEPAPGFDLVSNQAQASSGPLWQPHPQPRGTHQGVDWLVLASSSTTRLQSPMAPSLFKRATLSFGMTT